MLDYAANAVLHWRAEQILEYFEATCGTSDLDPDAVLIQHLEGTELSPDEFWARVTTNLKAKRIRMVFVPDEIPHELQTIVEFLNEAMSSADVLAVEIKRFQSETGQLTLVANTIGNTTTAQRSKEGRSEPTAKQQLYEDFWSPLMDQLRGQVPRWSSSRRKVPRWYALVLPAGFATILYNLQFTQDSRLRVTLLLRSKPVSGDVRPFVPPREEKRD